MQLVLRVIAILSFVVAIVWWFVSPGFEPLSAVLVGLLTLLTSFVVEKSKGESETLDERNRRVMLDHVENFWVKGILEKSLHGAALLELGIKEDPGAVHYPWTIQRESTGEALPAGKSMLAIFQEIGMGRSMLILGAPGAGKTTMLLELTRHLVQRAREKDAEPLPVVFNLASWTEKQTLADWLAEQLNLVYYVPKKIAPSWVQGNRMLLLLDGLDEVKEGNRAKCVEAINQFRNQYGLTSLIVCSRTKEYTATKTKLSFEGAITLQPLTPNQISAYLDRFGNSLASVRLLLARDEVLKELAETPLMLSIMALAYKDLDAKDVIATNNLEDQRKHLFDTYIDRMFERPTRFASAPFTKPETLRYLSWLAHKMIQHNLITYKIESMQSSWLTEQRQTRLYRLSIGLGVALFTWLIFGLPVSFLQSLHLVDPMPIFWLIVGLGGVGLGGALSAWTNNRITMVDRLNWLWKEVWGGLRFGLLLGLIFVLSDVLTGRLRLTSNPSDGVIFALGAGLFGVLIGGLTSKQVEETTYPAQRLKQTLFNGLFSILIIGLGGALISGLLVGLITGLNYRLDFGLQAGLVVGLFVGMLGGLIGGLKGGYYSLIQHYSLRLVLTQYHLLPRQVIAFLDYAVGLIFLRRVGGSYIFVHRLLMEHFAELEV